MSAYRKLKPQQRKFVDLLVRGRCNGTQAIRQIRPHLRAPEVLAAQWKALPGVKAAIDEREAEAIEAAGIKNAAVLIGTAETADFDVRKLAHPDGRPKRLHELDEDTARIVQGVVIRLDGSIEYKLASRNEARKLLGQHLKLWTERHEIGGLGGGAIKSEVQLKDPVEAARAYQDLMNGGSK